MNSYSLLAFAVFLLILFVSYQLWKFANFRRSRVYVVAIVWVGWFFAFSVVLLLPIDVSSSNHHRCIALFGHEDRCDEPWIQLSDEVLIILWKILYWGTYILCWTAYPLLQSYTAAGEFSIMERWRSALKDNLIFYTVCGVVMAFFIILVTIKNGLKPGDLYGVAIASSTAWGLFVLLCLLGYGLVEIPKRLWRQANRQLTLRYYQFQAVTLRESYEKARKDLEATLKLVKKYNDRVNARDPFRPFVDQIVEKCPSAFKDVLYGEGDADLSYSKLVDLHKKVMFVDFEVIRSKDLYERLLLRAFRLEDIIKAKGNPEWKIRWSFRSRRRGRFADQVDICEWVWKVYMEPWALRLAAVVTATLSLAVVWSEVVFAIPFDMSIFSLILTPSLSFTLQWLFIFVPVSYIAYSASWSLFELRLFNYYRLLDHHLSDQPSLLFSAAYLCRLVAPMAYNYLLMIRIESTAFLSFMGPINVASALGSQYNIYFPIVLVVFCFANAFNLYTKFVTTFCFRRFANRFVFDENFTDSQIDRGREVIAHERELRERGLNPPSGTGPILPTAERRPADETSRFPSFRKMFGRETTREHLLDPHSSDPNEIQQLG